MVRSFEERTDSLSNVALLFGPNMFNVSQQKTQERRAEHTRKMVDHLNI